jgi:hypothetical protein
METINSVLYKLQQTPVTNVDIDSGTIDGVTIGSGTINNVVIGGTTPAAGSFSTLKLATSTPASASATGVAGTIAWDAGFIYVCTATNTWERVAIASWT